MLTPKQDKFCRLIVSGKSGRDSYLEAYGNNSNDNTAYKESGKLLAKSDIQDRIKELKKPLELHAQTQAITEREKKRAIIWEGIEECKAAGDHAGVARYMDILNKMDAEYININRNIEDKPAQIVNLDTDTLKQIASGK